MGGIAIYSLDDVIQSSNTQSHVDLNKISREKEGITNYLLSYTAYKRS